MTEQKDHMFLVTIPGQKLAIAFCSAEGIDKEGARMKVLEVLLKHKAYKEIVLSYLGMVDYQDMDITIENQLHFFEKYPPVWLLFSST